MITLNIQAGDVSGMIQKRKLGKLNIGLYCDSCGEFSALIVDEASRIDVPVAFACDGPIGFTCPFCQHQQQKVVSELEKLVLTEGNKRRPPRPAASRP